MPEVIDSVKRIISEKGLKQKSVANWCGYTEDQLSNMLNGRRAIRDSDIVNLCDALGVTPNDLLGYTKPPKKGARDEILN